MKLTVDLDNLAVISAADLNSRLVALHLAYSVECLDNISLLDEPLKNFHLCTGSTSEANTVLQKPPGK